MTTRGKGDWAAWAELARWPMAATVVADLLAGAFAAGQEVGAWLVPALIASLALYTAGMVGNDLVDLPRDRHERPERPLPSGRLSPPRAARMLAALVVIGLAVPALAFPPMVALAWALLALAVTGYDLGPRRWPLWGPLWLGLCRGLDVLAGGLAAGGALPPTGPLFLMAGLFGFYGAAITVQAEHEGANGWPVLAGRLLPVLPVAALAFWLAGWPSLIPLAVLLFEVTWRLSRRPTALQARKLTGAWVRGFLLLGAAAALSSGQPLAGGLLGLLWLGCTWAVGPGPQS